MIRRTSLVCLGIATIVFSPLAGQSEDWRQFRGNDISGVATSPLPEIISGDSIKWEVDLPGRGLSAPIVVGDRVYLSASSGFDQDRLHLLCFDKQSGEQIWERQFWATGRTACNPTMCNATPTPCSDGKRLFASFSSNDVICTDLEGNLQWFRGLNYDYPNASNSLGMASSPVVVDETLILQLETDADSFAFGLDVADGTERWRKDRPRKANWTSPTIVQKPQPLVLLQSADGVVALEPKSGEEVWTYENGAATIPSSVVDGDVLYIPSHGITAVDLKGGQGETVWNSGPIGPGRSSPVFVNDLLVTVGGAGLRGADPKTGKRLWEERVRGDFYSSPIVSGNRLYLFSDSGMAYVFEVSEEEARLVSDFDFGEKIFCTPAASEGAIYVRSDGHLWKIAE